MDLQHSGLQQINGISFIGGGNMAISIIGGLIQNGFTAQDITVSEPNPDSATNIAKQFQTPTTPCNVQATKANNIVILAVKPQILKSVCEEIAIHLTPQHLVISIAAGIDSAALRRWLGVDAIIRTMPNTPSLVGEGACGMYPCPEVTGAQKNMADQIMQSVGITVWVEDENLIDSIIAVSGSGPAYFFLMIESMIESGVKQGLSHEVSSKLALQTAFGASKLALESKDIDMKELRRRVTSPNGTTQKAIESFESNGFRDVIDQAMQACAHRAKVLAIELGKD